jgi:hypothetical protein
LYVRSPASTFESRVTIGPLVSPSEESTVSESFGTATQLFTSSSAEDEIEAIAEYVLRSTYLVLARSSGHLLKMTAAEKQQFKL